ncbi:MAG: alpha/beta hydrolase [Kiritimatiellae bacterium]|nr:alpha/beta hydrolase [Kiritimatiellia bacterium]
MVWLGIIMILVAGLWGWARWFEWHQAFHPSRTVEGDPADAGLVVESVDFVAADGCRLHGWWIPHPEATGSLIYCHGNAGNLTTRIDLAARLHTLPVNLFLFDYRGYGRSKGIPSERGVYQDALAAYEVVRAKHGDMETPPVMVYGASLGGPVAVEVAVRRPVSGLILECTFTSSRELGRHWFPRLPVSAISRYQFDALAKIGSVKAPVLIAHSPEDQLIPYALGRRLYDAAPEPKQFVDLQGGHDEAGWNQSPEYWPVLEAFVREHFQG